MPRIIQGLYKFAAEINREGKKWEVTIITSGHANTQTGPVYLSETVLKNSIKKFEDLEVYVHGFGNTGDGKPDVRHRPAGLDDPNGLFYNKAGWIKNVKVVRGDGKLMAVGTFECINPAIRSMLIEIWAADKNKMPEFSIDTDVKGQVIDGVMHIEEFGKPNSLDMVTKGAFHGAGFNRLVASKNLIKDKKMNKLIKKILASIKAGNLKLSESIEGKSDKEIVGLIKNALGIEDDAIADIREMIKAAITPELLASILKFEKIDEMKAAIQKLIAQLKNQKAGEDDEADDADDDADADSKDDDSADTDADDDADEKKEDEDAAEDDKKDDDADSKDDDNKKASMKAAEARINKLEKKIAIQASENLVASMVQADTTLCEVSKEKLKAAFSGKVAKKEDVKKAITAEKKYLDRIVAANTMPNAQIIKMGDTPRDKMAKALEIFINPAMEAEYAKEGFRLSASEKFRDLLDAVLTWAGHRRFEMTSGGQGTMKAAATSDFTTVFQDVMNKQIRKQYELAMVEDRLSKLVEETSLETLDTQHIYDIGSFGLVDAVAEGGTYTELSNPADVEATYSVSKRGNIFKVTEEMFFTAGNKVTQLVRQFPRKMASSAKATRNKFIADLITGCNGSTINALTIYDGTPLYTSAHGNLSATALAYASFYTGWTAMANQTVLSSGLPAEIKAKYLVVPHELAPTATLIVSTANYPSQTSNGVPLSNPYAALGVEVLSLPNYYLCSDTNNWYLVGDKNGYPTIQIGYFQNQRVPQMFLQNQPTVGDVFASDEWTWKVKWRWGGAVTDYRTFYAGVVAGN